jgi:hypothetical protein
MENNQTARLISLISKYSRTHTSYYDECFELEFPLDLSHYLKGCKKEGHLKSLLKILFQHDLASGMNWLVLRQLELVDSLTTEIAKWTWNSEDPLEIQDK